MPGVGKGQVAAGRTGAGADGAKDGAVAGFADLLLCLAAELRQAHVAWWHNLWSRTFVHATSADGVADYLERVRNYHISVREWQDNVVFLHKIVPGATDQSFGIHVAKIAGVPMPVIERAKEVLLNLEKKELNRLVKDRITGKLEKLSPKQKTLFPEDAELKVWDEIRDKLKEIDISKITPLEALNILHYLKHKSENFK